MRHPWTPTEKEFQRQVVQLARLLGWMAYHTYDSRRSTPGFPDLVLVKPPKVIFAELKVGRRRPTVPQLVWLQSLASSGQDVRLWRPTDWPEIERLLKGDLDGAPPPGRS
jgi:hypothetical protein